MSRMRSAIGVIVLVGGVVTAAAAQPVTRELTVDELVVDAVREHPDLQAARLEVAAAAARVGQAGLRPNPMLDLGGQKALGFDNTFSVGLTLPLDLNGRKEGRVGVAERELDVRRAQLAERERRLRVELRLKAGEVLAARRNLATTSELLDANRQALEVVRHRVREGAVPSIDENLQRVEVNRLETTTVVLGSRVEVLTLQLKTVAGVAVDVALALRGELAGVTGPPELDATLQQAMRDRPDVRIARAEAAAYGARVRKEESEGRWDASVNVGYQRQDTGFDLMGVTERGGLRPIRDVFHYFGAGVSIVLPVRNRNQGNIEAARAEGRAAERRLQLLELVVRQEVAAAFVQQAAARHAADLYDSGVRVVARRNLAVVRQSYELGRGSLLDVIGEQRRYLEIESGYTTTLKDLYDAGVEIERATGTTPR